MATANNDSKQRNSQENLLSPGALTDQLPRPFGRLTLLRRLARGGMGEVYLAATRGIEGAERPCVVKVIRSEHIDDKSFRARFLDETRIQAQLQHPGVAQIVEAATTADDAPYAVVEYVEGRHMGELLARSNQLGVKLGWADAVAIGTCFGDALAHVHERTDASGRPLQISHRDLSPQNVMVGYGGDLKLIDFGTARGENRRCRTVSGIVFAKPGYVAPEVANQIPGGPQADLYAFGVMVWELIAGHRFLQGDAVEHQARVARGDLALPAIAAEAGAPERLDEILQRLTVPDLDERYQDARAAVGDLVELLKQAPSLADGDRSVRGRIAQLMGRLYPAEPARSRADFARRVALARKTLKGEAQPSSSVSTAQGKAPSARPGIPEPSPAPAPAEERLDGVLAGTRYRLIREIASGTMGEVWEARHLDLGRTVALKLIPEAASRSAEARQRFRSEARSVARLEHPGVVNIFDFGIAADGRFFYVMELLTGETLAGAIARGPLPWRRAVNVLLEATAALSAAHRAGIVHRDITPSNLFLADNGVKLIDFGVAKQIEVGDKQQTEAPRVFGTPEYISPEQASGAGADARSDLYALGVVLYEALTGRVPHPLGEGGSPTLPALLTAKITRTPAPPTACAEGSEIPKALDRIVLRLLDRDAAKRFASAEELIDALQLTLQRASGARRRFPVALASGAAAFVAIFALGFFLAGQNSSSELTSQAAPADEVLNLDALVRAQQQPTPVVAGSAEATQAATNVARDVAPEPKADLASASSDPVSGEVDEVLRLVQRNRKINAHHRMKKLAEQHPESAAVQRGLVTTAKGVQAWGEAMAAAEKWVELEPGVRSQVALARMQRATLKGDPVATLEAVLQQFPEDEEASRLLQLYSGKRVAVR